MGARSVASGSGERAKGTVTFHRGGTVVDHSADGSPPRVVSRRHPSGRSRGAAETTTSKDRFVGFSRTTNVRGSPSSEARTPSGTNRTPNCGPSGGGTGSV